MSQRDIDLSDAQERLTYAYVGGDANEIAAARAELKRLGDIPGDPPSEAALDRIAKNLGIDRAELDRQFG